MFARLPFSSREPLWIGFLFPKSHRWSIARVSLPMAIAFVRVSIHSRSKGHSAVAASAYRSASRLVDERTGVTYDFQCKQSVVYTTLLLPEGASSAFNNREYLWNQVEASEKRKDAQLCKDIVLALPKEISLEYQIELAERFAQTYFVTKGVPADIAIHDHQDGNPHAHILVPTRRLERDRFSTYKARDLNPVFVKGSVIEADVWGQRWRETQEHFFKEKGLTLTVDANHLIPERHEGRHQFPHAHVKQENAWIRKERQSIAKKDPVSILHHLNQEHSVFTRRAVETLLFKTFKQEENAQAYLARVERVLKHPEAIFLGKNSDGECCYTTREQYRLELNLRKDIERLLHRQHHRFSVNPERISAQYSLDEEQCAAVQYVADSSDIAVVIGRPGTGKSYLLKPVRRCFEKKGYELLGTALAGKVARSLQHETGIPSSTLTSLNGRLASGKLRLTSKHIVLIDEAGMVDVNQMAFLLRAVRKAGSKVILIGDPDQLKPIHKGEIFRAITHMTGFIELDHIKRQKDALDRQASLDLAKGHIDKALSHYSAKGALSFHESAEETQQKLVEDWQRSLTKDTLKETLLLAFTRVAVADLNEQAREALRKNEIIGKEDCHFGEGKDSLPVTIGERLLLKKNDKTLGVCNGDLGTVVKIRPHQMELQLDNGARITLPKTYTAIDYGYALTVHKSQGITAKHVRVLVDSKRWDRHLSFVAMTRHQETLKIYTDKVRYPSLDQLQKALSRSVAKANVMDWPVDKAVRFGLNPEKRIGKVLNKLDTYLNPKGSIERQFADLKKAYPSLVDFEKQRHKRQYLSGYFAERMDKQLQALSQALGQDDDFMSRLKAIAPATAQAICQRVVRTAHELER